MTSQDNNNKISQEQLTAYALGELSAKERAEVEAYLRKNPIQDQDVSEIQSFAKMLRNEYAAEPLPELTRTQKAQIVGVKKKSRFKFVLLWSAPVFAAGFLAMILMPKFQKFQKVQKFQNKAGTESSQVMDEIAYVPADSSQPKEMKPSKPKQTIASVDKKDSRVGRLAKKKPSPKKRPKVIRKPNGVNLSKLGLGTGKVLNESQPSPRAQFKMSSGGSGTSKPGVYGGLGRSYRKSIIPPSPQGMPLDRDSGHQTEQYAYIAENEFISPIDDPQSTFSIDVDTASYSNVRRFITQGKLPPKDAVRLEEMINYFTYQYQKPAKGRPVHASVEIASAPWNPKHRLVRVGVTSKAIAWEERPAANLVFLIDVSGSMSSSNKLPLLRKAMKLLVDQLQPRDKVAMVVYAGASGVVLPATAVEDKQTIMDALDRLQAGGSTNGGAGIELAYKIATENFVKSGVNRVILATDGDFNVGTSSRSDLIRMIEKKRKTGVFLSVMGFGMGNYKDDSLEKLANKGNGNYAYIDTIKEAKKVFVEQVGGTLVTVAKDVKIQVEFNPNEVNAFRLIGYENRKLAHQDFNNDKKDAGEIGSGLQVTAFYEVVPKGVKVDFKTQDKLRYQEPLKKTDDADSGELMLLKLRFKKPNADKSSLVKYTIRDKGDNFDDASDDFRFAASVASFGMILRDSKFKGKTSYPSVEKWAKPAANDDYRKEFLEIVGRASKLTR